MPSTRIDRAVYFNQFDFAKYWQAHASRLRMAQAVGNIAGEAIHTYPQSRCARSSLAGAWLIVEPDIHVQLRTRSWTSRVAAVFPVVLRFPPDTATPHARCLSVGSLQTRWKADLISFAAVTMNLGRGRRNPPHGTISARCESLRRLRRETFRVAPTRRNRRLYRADQLERAYGHCSAFHLVSSSRGRIRCFPSTLAAVYF